MDLASLRLARVFYIRKLKRNFRDDFPASIVVFLVALPLCLGIALASDAPLFAGVVTGIVAGILVSLLSGSELSVSGPAAGLTVIVAAGIRDLGGYDFFLCAVVLSGVVQIILGFARAGAIASLFPNSVIKGMLCAIGITIILKQLPHALGGADSFASELAYLGWLGKSGTLDRVLGAVLAVNVSALLISVFSLIILIYWDKSPLRKRYPILARIPAPLLAVVLGGVLNQLFHFQFPHLELQAEDGHLVTLPVIHSFSALMEQLRFPNFQHLFSEKTWVVAITIAAVGSIETLLCLESTDKLDPQRRVSSPNRELVAQGIGNSIAGFLGGIPMTSVIVRSSANIYSGARTRFSGFYHGLILLCSVLMLAQVLNHVPLASLAAVLLVVGYKLAHPSLFLKMKAMGSDQFIPFIVTVLAILATDLLKGIVVGTAVGLFFVLRATYQRSILLVEDAKDVLIRFTKDLTFIHKNKLRRTLSRVQPGSKVVIDGSRTQFIDSDIYEMLEEFRMSAKLRDIDVTFKHIEKPSNRERKGGITQKTATGK